MKMKEYRISDLFEIVEVQKIQWEANDFPTMKDETHTIPLLTSAGNNQGFSGYGRRKHAALKLWIENSRIYCGLTRTTRHFK